MKFKFYLVIFVMFSLIAPCLSAAVNLPVSDSGVLFVVNNPNELVMADINLLMKSTQNRLLANKTMTDRDLANFWAVLRDHGAPNAGTSYGQTRVGLVVSSDNPSSEGILVLQGNFDKAKVFELLSRRYSEHVNEHLSDARQKEFGIGKACKPISGFKSHCFVLPVRDRELHIVDMGNTVLFSSHKKGKMNLLEKTIDVLVGKTPFLKIGLRSSKIVYAFEPTADEKEQLLGQLDDAYGRYKDGRMENRRGVKRFTEKIRTIVTDKKYSQVKDAVGKLEKGIFTAVRGWDSVKNFKELSLQLIFEDDDAAQLVKASLVRHLVAEMKKPYGKAEISAFQNPKITVDDRTVTLQVPLETEQDQIRAFTVMAGYVARGILATKQTPLVRQLKTIANRQLAAGRQLEKQVAIELSRTSFFSLGKKFSLMYDSMRVKADIRKCEDTYVDLNSDPKALSKAVENLAEASTRDLDILDKLIETRQKNASKASSNSIPTFEIAQLRQLRSSIAVNARSLLTNAYSPAFARSGAVLEKGVQGKLETLAQKAGLPPMVYSQSGQTGMSGFVPSGAMAPTVNTANGTSAQVTIPAGMTLEKALADYQNAYKAYTGMISNGTDLQIREAYETYISKHQIYKAIKEQIAAQQSGS